MFCKFGWVGLRRITPAPPVSRFIGLFETNAVLSILVWGLPMVNSHTEQDRTGTLGRGSPIYIYQHSRSYVSPITRGKKGRNVYVAPYCDRKWHDSCNIFGFLKTSIKNGVFDLHRLNITPYKFLLGFFMKSWF